MCGTDEVPALGKHEVTTYVVVTSGHGTKRRPDEEVLRLRIQFCRYMTPCHWITTFRRFEDTTFLRDVRKRLSRYTVPCPRRLEWVVWQCCEENENMRCHKSTTTNWPPCSSRSVHCKTYRYVLLTFRRLTSNWIIFTAQ